MGKMSKLLKKYRLAPEEQETTFATCKTDGNVRVYTSCRDDMRRLDAMCERYPDVYTKTWTDGTILADGHPAGARYEFPKRFLRLGKPASEAQLAAARANVDRINFERQNAP
jgi:hypothetical protein